MMTREEIRELAEFQCKGTQNCAVSFYFQPQAPQDKSHRGDMILVKDLFRDALHAAENDGRNEGARLALSRVSEAAKGLHWNQSRAKAIFACHERDFWREYDLPPQLPGTELVVGRRFHLKPLAVLLGAQPNLGVALVDRHRARIFELRLDELMERECLFHPMSRRGRGDGFGGYDAGHSERRVSDEIQHHYKLVAERLKEQAEKGVWEKLLIGCLDVNWREFEPHLHPYVKKRLLGRFSIEMASAVPDEIREQAAHLLVKSLDRRRCDVVNEALSHAKSRRRGVTGLRRVLRSLELGEVRSLILDEKYSARAVECPHCGHLDSHLIKFCPLCGRGTRELEDVCEAVVPAAIRRDIELFYVKDNPELNRVGSIAALLRFRATENQSAIAIAS